MTRRLLALLPLTAALVLTAGGTARADDTPPAGCTNAGELTAVATRCERATTLVAGGSGVQAVTVTPDGATSVTAGYVTGPNGQLAYGAQAVDTRTGAVRWTSTYQTPPQNYSAQAYTAAMSPDGTFVVLGGQAQEAQGSSSTFRGALAAFAVSDGHLLWRYSEPDSSEVYRVSFGGDGTVYAGGNTYTYGDGVNPTTRTGDDWFVDALSPAGVRRWHVTATSPYVPGSTSDYLDTIAASPDGSAVAVAGRWAGGTQQRTVVLDGATGATRWAQLYADGVANYPHQVAWSGDGSTVAVAGESQPVERQNTAEVLGYRASDGTSLFRSVSPATSPSFAPAVALNATGTVAFTVGETTTATAGVSTALSADWTTRAISTATGAALWSTTRTAPQAQVPTALVLAPDGTTVFTTGYMQTGTGTDVLSIAYHSTDGAEQWLANYSTPQVTYAQPSLAIASGGSTLVSAATAQTAAGGTRVIAYDPRVAATQLPAALPEAPVAVLLPVVAGGLALAVGRRRQA